MTAESASLRPVLETSDMLEIDGLHAFDFELTELKLVITAMDGRAENAGASQRRRWTPPHLTTRCKAGPLPVSRASTA